MEKKIRQSYLLYCQHVETNIKGDYEILISHKNNGFRFSDYSTTSSAFAQNL